jgi:glutamate-5-semialdehyde dehydrogenase
MLAQAPTAQKAHALNAAATAIRDRTEAILAANAADMAAARAAGLSDALLDRLLLDFGRVAAIADALEAVAALRDPVGEVISSSVRPNGMRIERVRVPIGVIAIIHESRPNVTADAGALCLMSGNAAIIRAGSEARGSAGALHGALVVGLEAAGLPADAVQFVDTADRAIVGALLKAAGAIDLVVPRGGKSLVARVQEEARVPVLAHLDGICHAYVDAAADLRMASDIVFNAKMRRTGVCGALETLLIDRRVADHAGPMLSRLLDAGCEVRASADLLALDPRLKPASPEDWDTEYLAPILSVASVDGVAGAIAHVAAHGSGHTDVIVTSEAAVARQFLDAVDSAIVGWNVSTQFADGGEFGLGAEIGISTGRLHARGPVALEGLTTYKYRLIGDGQVRPG